MSEPAHEKEYQAGASPLTPGRTVPVFELSDAEGRLVSNWDYKGRRNLVLFFGHGGGCPGCGAVLAGFAENYQRYQDLDAEVLTIVRDSLKGIRAVARALRLPFPVLGDSAGDVTARFTYTNGGLGAPAAAIFVTDRYGALYHQVLADREADLPGQRQILDWLQFIAIQCEECGVPEWPGN